MSDAKGTEKLLAGHPPAVMVGGMRVGGIVRAERTKSESKNSEPSLSDEEKTNVTNDSSVSNGSNSSIDKNNNKLVNGSKSTAGMMVNGVQVDLKEAFPTDAVKHIHEKPHPSHENNIRPSNKRAQPSIFQPRSYNQPTK